MTARTRTSARWRRAALLAILLPLAPAGCGDSTEPRGDPDYEIVYIYTTGSSLAGDLYVITPDGRARRPLLAAESFSATSPAWSPDGRRVVFLRIPRTDANAADLGFVNADGTGLETVRPAVSVRHPEWSPDGSRLAIYYFADQFTFGHAVMNVDGSGFRPLAVGGGLAARASWSPVADSLLLSETSGNGEVAELWLVDVGGTTARLVARYASGGRWSPDGRRIAFFGRADTASAAAENDGLVVMNADGSGRRLLTAMSGVGATWSPDGRRIAFFAQTFPRPGELVTDIYVVDAAGGTPVNITRHQPEQHAHLPDWRPARPAR